MDPYEFLLMEDARSYKGRNGDLVRLTPAFYDFLINLAANPKLETQFKALALEAITYFIEPLDVLPERYIGPYGLIDDVFLTALLTDILVRESVDVRLLEASWGGDDSIVELSRYILTREQDLIGNRRERVLSRVEKINRALEGCGVSSGIGATESESILCWGSDEGFLNYDSQNLVFHSVDRALLNYIENIAMEAGEFCFLYPVFRFNLTLPICLELLYSLNYPRPRGVKRDVLLVSDYTWTFIQNYVKVKAEGMWLFEYPFPIGVVKSDGTITRKRPP